MAHDRIDPSVLKALSNDGARHTAWLYLDSLPAAEREQYMVKDDGTVTADMWAAQPVYLHSAHEIAEHIDEYKMPGAPIDDARSNPAPLLCVTTNCETLRRKGKRDIYAKQYKTRRAHASGLQEARGWKKV